METKNAVIIDATIGINVHGILDARIKLGYGDKSVQVFGNYGLYSLKDGLNGKNYAGHFIYRVLEAAGADGWEQLKGKAIRVVADDSHIEAIGHIITDTWFYPGEEFKQAN
jgi:hypothetical protein